MTQNQQVIERDYYYKRQVTAKHIAKVAGFSFVGNVFTYFIVNNIFSILASLSSSDDVLYMIVGSIICLPVAILLPCFPIYKYLSFLLPRLYSLADAPKSWYKKAIRLISGSEILRFVLGLLPLNLTKYGVTTSPVTYLIYELLWIKPLDKYDDIWLNNEVALLDFLVFLIIYLIYFAVYEFFLLKKIKKEFVRQQKYLEGCLNEREKYYNFNKRRLDG